MCLAVPGRILAIHEMSATVDFCGVERETLIDLLPDLQVGEYILVHAGFAIQRLDPSEAEEIFKQFKEIADAMDAQQREQE
jgi:hydrogenase expression/formation protein HypC